MRARLVALTVALWAAPLAARAEEPEQLKLARYNFEYGKYEEAVRLVDELNLKKALDEDTELLEAWKIHGLANFYLGRRVDARSSFVKLLSIDPDFALDPLLVPPLAVVEFDSVKKENEGLLAPIRERRRAIAEQKKLEESARRQLLQEEERRRNERAAAPALVQRVEKTPFILNFVPFGVPQFEQGRTGTGTLVAAAQGLTLGTTIFSYYQFGALVQTYTNGKIIPGGKSRAETWRIVNWVAFGLAAAVYGYGTWDAIRHHQAESVSYLAIPADSLKPQAPAPSQKPGATLYLAPLENGAAAGLAGQF